MEQIANIRCSLDSQYSGRYDLLEDNSARFSFLTLKLWEKKRDKERETLFISVLFPSLQNSLWSGQSLQYS